MLGLSIGLTQEEIAGMADPAQCSAFDETDRLVLRYTEVLTLENRVDDDLYQQLERTFSKQERLELCLSTAMAGMINRVHATFHTDVDASTESFLADRQPSPDK